MTRLVFILLFLTTPFTFHGAKASEKKAYPATRLSGAPPQIDGHLTDEAWESGTWESGFIQHEPFNRGEPSQQTSFKILYDDNNIYVAIRAHDSAPDSIVPRITRRDNIDGDVVGIALDSYFDQRTAFQFLVNAAGVKIDMINTNDGQNDDFTWDPVWYVKTSINEDGWVAEMQIPLQQIRFSTNENHTWGLQVARILYRKQEVSFWQHIPRDAPGFVHQFGLLTNLHGIKPRKLAEFIPYSVAKTETFLKQEGNPFADGNSSFLSGGMDGKIGITSDLTLNFTVNPDFGQIEADPSEVNLSAFETWLEEKRPFFVEGRNIYNFRLSPGDGDNSGENLFYSRRIGRSPQYRPDLTNSEYMDFPENTSILGAFKLSGKTNSGWSVGLLESLTAQEKAETFQSGNYSHRTVEPMTNYFLGRLQKDSGSGNTIIGGMITATNRRLSDSALYFLHRSAYSGGIDFWHAWKDKTYSISMKTYFSLVSGEEEALIRTQTSSARYFQRPDAKHLSVDSTRRSLAGHGGSLEFMKAGNGHWNYGSFLTWKSPGLELNDIGYVRNTDEIMQVFWIGYRIWEPFSIFRRININYAQWHGFEFSGKNIFNGNNINFTTQFINYWSFGTGINYQGKSLSKSFLRGGPSMKLPAGINTWINIRTDQRKKVKAGIGANLFSSFVHYNRSTRFMVSLEYQPMDAFSISVSPGYSTNQPELQYVDQQSFLGKKRYIHASMDQKTYSFTLRLNYSLTPDLSIQYYGAPFFSTGKYSSFKYITNPKAPEFSSRFSNYEAGQLSFVPDESRFFIDEDMDGTADYSFEKPDFNAMFLNSNLVTRWEFKPGSVLFLVWSQGRSQYDTNGEFFMQTDFTDLFDIHPHNIFLVKFSYRFGL